MSESPSTNKSKNKAKRIMGQENGAKKDDGQDEVKLSFGAMLQQARLKQKLRLEDISAELFILQRHLQALEEEQFDALPQAAFARGFAINYAKFLGLDSAQVGNLFDAAYPEALMHRSAASMTTPLQPMGPSSSNLNNRVRLNPLLIIAVAALIVLVIFLSRMVINARQEPEPAQPLAEDLTAQAQEQGAAVSTDANGISASGSSLSAGSDISGSNSNTVGSTSLEVILTDATMINITDATGNRLMTGSQTRGNYQLAGMPPFKIDIDNIDNVSLLVNQEAVSLSDYVTESDIDTGKPVKFELTL